MPMVASDAVQRLVKNRQSREVAPPLSESVPDMTLEQAYAIQGMLEKILVERGDRFRMSGKPRGTDFVADGVLANAVVLGGPPTPVSGLDLSVEGMVYEENGQRVATAAAAEVLGNPLNSLAWLANALGKLGGKLRAGDVVMTGSISKVFRPKAGDAVRASFTRLGSVSCRFV